MFYGRRIKDEKINEKQEKNQGLQ